MRSDDWIVIPNWDVYQHYKHRDPVWLRDYVRQLANPQWLDLNLAQRGLLWTSRLAYAHHNGRLRIRHLYPYLCDENQTLTRCLPVMAKRLSHAGLMGLVASEPLSLKYKDVDARTRENNISGHLACCPLCEVGGGRHLADCPTLKGATA
jgi:hypothetical protein